MLRATRTFFALALALAFAGVASATPVDFTLGVERGPVGPDDVITFTVSLVTPTDITGYELTIQYDADELDWDGSSDLMGGLSATPQPGAAAHKPGGMKVAALAFNRITATDLFSISFIVVNPTDDGAFDDFRVFLAPAGCDLLPEGCVRIPPGCDVGADPTCDDIPSNGSGLSEFPGDPAVEIGNAGFKVEVGVEGYEVMALSVPEPTIWGLLGAGLVPLWLRRRR